MTPRKLDALIKRLEHRQQHEDMMLAQIAQVTANFSFRGPEKPYPLDAFMPTVASQQDNTEAEQEAFASTFIQHLRFCRALQDKQERHITVAKGDSPITELERQIEKE